MPAVLSTLAFFEQFAVTTAVDDHNYELTRVYPNPASQYIQVELPADFGSFEYKIFDYKGHLIAGGKAVNEPRIHVSRYPAGIYHLLVEGKSGRLQSNLSFKDDERRRNKFYKSKAGN